MQIFKQHSPDERKDQRLTRVDDTRTDASAGTFGTIFVVATIIGIYYLLSSLMKEELASVKSYTQQIQLLGSELKDVQSRRSELEQKVNSEIDRPFGILSKLPSQHQGQDPRPREGKSSGNMGLLQKSTRFL